jgi:hypothetical protein
MNSSSSSRSAVPQAERRGRRALTRIAVAASSFAILAAWPALSASAATARPASVTSAASSSSPAVPDGSALAGGAQASASVTEHSGTWHVSGCAVACGKSVNTASYSAYNKAETCIDIKSGHTSNWTIYLIWYNAGNNTVLFKLSGVSTGTYCSGWRTMSRPDDKVYDRIYASVNTSISGTYNIWTN